MKAITALTTEEHEELQHIYDRLKWCIADVNWNDIIEDLQCCCGYAHYKFRGKYTPHLVELLGHQPNQAEIIMLVDHGFSHFGATCTVNHETREFYGRVNTD